VQVGACASGGVLYTDHGLPGGAQVINLSGTEQRTTGSWVSLWYCHPASTQYTNACFLTSTQVCIACGVEGINQANVIIDYVS
jgi:hypothetical protein